MLADASRVRLLALLVDEELTVAELSTITRLKQPRVSTPLARLKETGLVVDRRSGVAAYYRAAIGDWPTPTRALWESLHQHTRDAVLSERIRSRPAGSTIVYVTLQKTAEQVAADLAAAGFAARAYHAGMAPELRNEVQEWWRRGRGGRGVGGRGLGEVDDEVEVGCGED